MVNYYYIQTKGKNGLKWILQSLVIALGLSLLLGSYFTSPALAQSKSNVTLPTVATLKKLVNGDLKCYITFTDDSGKQYQDVGATFDVCQNAKTYLNQKVSWQYGLVSVNDCRSAEPCGKTRIETLITRMQLVSGLPAPQVSLIGEAEKSRSYNLTVSGSDDILFVRCPQSYEPKLGYLRNVEALQCEQNRGAK